MESSISLVGQIITEQANEIRLNLKEIESVLGKDNSTYKRVQRRLNLVIKQASRIGLKL